MNLLGFSSTPIQTPSRKAYMMARLAEGMKNLYFEKSYAGFVLQIMIPD